MTFVCICICPLWKASPPVSSSVGNFGKSICHKWSPLTTRVSLYYWGGGVRRQVKTINYGTPAWCCCRVSNHDVTEYHARIHLSISQWSRRQRLRQQGLFDTFVSARRRRSAERIRRRTVAARWWAAGDSATHIQCRISGTEVQRQIRVVREADAHSIRLDYGSIGAACRQGCCKSKQYAYNGLTQGLGKISYPPAAWNIRTVPYHPYHSTKYCIYSHPRMSVVMRSVASVCLFVCL